MKKALYFLASLVIVVGLAWISLGLGKMYPILEFPFWAVIFGLFVGSILRLPAKLKGAALAEPYIKIGLVFLGASVNFTMIMAAGSRGLIQALIGVPVVFFATWFVARKFKLDEKFAAILATAVSICGVSAAIAAAASVMAKKEHLTYAITLVIVFALAFMFAQPYAAKLIGLSPAVAGSWIGNNIDNTAAVVGAAKMHSEGALKVASIVKMGQNCLIGVVAFLLAFWCFLKEKTVSQKPKLSEIWTRFPKFVLGFVLFSILASAGVFSAQLIKIWLNPIRSWLFAMTFVSIGLTTSFGALKEIGGRPLYVFLIATGINLVTAFILAQLLFGNFII